MIEEVKVEGLDELLDAIKTGAGVDTTGATAGQVLTAIEDAGGDIFPGWTTPDTGIPTIGSGDNGKMLKAVVPAEGDPYAAWGEASGGDSLVYDNTVSTKIGEYHEHDGQTITVHVIKSMVVGPSSDVYLGNGQAAFDANIGDNAEILSCRLVAKDGYNYYSIPCLTIHNSGTLPPNISYTAQWNGSGLPSNGGPAKFYITYVEMTA